MSLFAELKRRNVFRVAAAYLALGSAWENRGDIAQAAAAYAQAIPHWRAAGGYDAFALHAQAELGDKLVMQGDLEAGVLLQWDDLAP